MLQKALPSMFAEGVCQGVLPASTSGIPWVPTPMPGFARVVSYGEPPLEDDVLIACLR